MAGEYIGKEPDHQAERLGEHTYDFNHRHKRNRNFEPGRDIRPEYILPIVLVAEDVDSKEGEEGQYQGHGYVAGDIGTSREERHYTHKIVDEDEEECGQQVRGVALVVLAHAGAYDV